MSVTDGQRIIAEFKIAGVYGVKGIGFHRLQFSVEADILSTPEPPVHIDEPRVFVLASPTQSGPTPLGWAVPETRWFAQTAPHQHRQRFLCFLDLSSEQFSALERLRAGGSLFFRLDLHLLVRSAQRGIQRSFEQPWLEVPESQWAKVLKDLELTELLLLSLELPLNETPVALHTAIRQLREAHSDLIAARYDQTVSACRLALDALDAALGNATQVEDAFKAFSSSRRQMPKRQRALLVTAAVRHYTHLAHHVDSGAQLECFSRQDAQFVLAATSAAIWDAVGELKLRLACA